MTRKVKPVLIARFLHIQLINRSGLGDEGAIRLDAMFSIEEIVLFGTLVLIGRDGGYASWLAWSLFIDNSRRATSHAR